MASLMKHFMRLQKRYRSTTSKKIGSEWFNKHGNFAVSQVTWIRHRDLHLLTVDKTTYTSDQRFVSVHNPQMGDWSLQVSECVRCKSHANSFLANATWICFVFAGAIHAETRLRSVRMPRWVSLDSGELFRIHNMKFTVILYFQFRPHLQSDIPWSYQLWVSFENAGVSDTFHCVWKSEHEFSGLSNVATINIHFALKLIFMFSNKCFGQFEQIFRKLNDAKWQKRKRRMDALKLNRLKAMLQVRQ